MKTILVPTDFSKSADNAAEYAVHLAKEINAKVILFHAFHVPIPVSEVPVMVISEDEVQKDCEALLKKEADILMLQSDVEVTYIARMGWAVEEILEEEKTADYIVMGMRGAGILTEVLMGSITTDTLRKTKTPMLVIPENVKYKKPEKIVFACDYDLKTDVHLLDTLKTFSKTFKSKILIVKVKQKNELVLIDEAVEGMKLESNLGDVEHLYYYPENENLVDGINEFVVVHNADMVAIIPHRYTLLESLFHKSVSKKLAFHTNIPLLVLPDNHKSVSAYLL